MKTLRPLLFLLFALLALPAQAEIVVIIHPDSPLQKLSTQEISDLYLGRKRTIQGERPMILDLTSDSPLRERFIKSLTGMPIIHWNAYWARLQFSGDMQPPPQMATSQAVIDTVSRNRLAIGYVNASQLNQSVRALLQLKE